MQNQHRPSTTHVLKAAEFKTSWFERFICQMFYAVSGKSLRSVFPSKPSTQTMGVSEVDLARIHRRLKQSRAG